MHLYVYFALHVHDEMSFLFILLFYITAGPNEECSVAEAEQPSETNSEFETKPGTPDDFRTSEPLLYSSNCDLFFFF